MSWSVLGPLLDSIATRSNPRRSGSSRPARPNPPIQERNEFLLCAVNQVPPFDATIDWPKEIEGVRMEHYIAWMKSTYWISVTLCPAISVPAGFTAEGLPVGIQIVGRRHDDLGVLQVAHAFEQVAGVGKVRPMM